MYEGSYASGISLMQLLAKFYSLSDSWHLNLPLLDETAFKNS